VSPPETGGVQPTRPSPAHGRALSHENYDLRTRDGLFICRVSREKAEQRIALGDIELASSRSGAFLRPVAPSSVPRRERNTGGAGKVLIGPRTPGVGSPARYRHNESACAAFSPVIQVVQGRPEHPGESAVIRTIGYERRTPGGYQKKK
jgi:hypothetical protein